MHTKISRSGLLVFSTLLIFIVACESSKGPSGTSGSNDNHDSKDIVAPLSDGDKPAGSGDVSDQAQHTKAVPFQNSATEPSGKFVEVSPEFSGVDFANKWPNEFDFELPNSFITAGVAVGDFDGDGKPDFFACRRSDGGRLFRNLGGFKFEDVTEKFKLDLDGLWGTGASFVDVNGDGRLDLSVCGFDSPNRMFINHGDHFEDQAVKMGLNYRGPSVAYSFCDYDRDGDLDAYLLTNHSSADPRPEVQVPTDDNGRPRVPPEYGESFYYVVHPNGEYVKEWAGRYDYLFRNDNGQFINVTKEAGLDRRPFFGLSSVWWDFDDDGWPDLFVSNDFKGPDHLYRNNGPNKDGVITFKDVAPIAFPHTPWFSMGSDIADINNDGLMDLMATDMGGTNHYRDKLSMGPMSGPDSRAWFLNVPTPPQYMRNCMFVNTGTHRFMEAAFLTSMAATDWTWTVRFTDFDQDGLQDVFFTNGMSRDWFNGDRIAKAKVFHDQAGGGKRGIRLGYEYWFMTPRYKNENLVFRNQGDFEFENTSKEWGFNHLGVSTGGATADFDGDGDMDIIINGFDEPLKIYDNQVASGNSLKVYLRGQTSNTNGIGARVALEHVDDDGVIRRQVRYLNANQGIMSSSEPVVHFGTGELDSIKSLTIDWPSGARQTVSSVKTNQTIIVSESEDRGAIAANNKRRISTKSKWMKWKPSVIPDAARHVELPYDDFQDQPLIPNKQTQLGPGIAWGDVDQDGDDDCFVGSAKGGLSRILKNEDGKLVDMRQDCFIDDRNSEDMGSLFFDADGDGDLDLYVVSGSGESRDKPERNQDRIYLNDGSGKFSQSTESWLPEIRSSGSCVVGSDFDRDGDIDLFVGGRLVPGEYPSTPESYLLENTGKGFKFCTSPDAEPILSSGMVTAAVWSDVNNDGWNDLVVTYDWGPVRVFANDKGSFYEIKDQVLNSYTGWYNSISSGDVDNDGDMDFVVGNFGLNTKYKANFDKPELLFYGEFDDSGKKHIVEAKYEKDVCYPRRGLGCSSHAMPVIKDKLPTFHEFAISSLEDIYSTDAIGEATRFEVNNLNSFVLINESDNDKVSFSVKSLPTIAQISPLFGSVLTDINGDNNLDLVVAQNFYGPQRETGYMDGGVSMLFVGKGDGSFEPVWPNQSGLVVHRDMTSLTTVDLNNDCRPDFLFAVNDKMPQFFESQPLFATKKIRVVGSPSNPNAIGARLILNVDGKTQVRDLHAGGYLSQCPPQVFVGGETVTKITIRWNDGKEQVFENPEFSGREFVAAYR